MRHSCDLMAHVCIKGLVIDYGEWGATKRLGGASEVLPLQRAGGKSDSHAEGGHKQFLGIFNIRARSFSHSEGEGAKSCHPLKGGT